MTRRRVERWLILLCTMLLCFTSILISAQDTDSQRVTVFVGKAEGGGTDIYVDKPIEVVNLTESAANDKSPRISPDGTKVAYLTNLQGSAWTLNVIGIDGTGLTQITPNRIDVNSFSWSEGGDLVFSASWGNPFPQVFFSNAAATTQYSMTPAGGIAFNPVWAGVMLEDIYFLYIPPGTSIPHFAHVSIDGSEPTLLTSDTTQKTGLTLSPDGQFAFWTGRADDTALSGIFTASLDGSYQFRLTDTPYNTCCAVPSPDGKTIFYLGDQYETTDIFRMNADGANQVNLTDGFGLDFIKFHQSHDGDEMVVAFEEDDASIIGRVREIRRMDTQINYIEYLADGSDPDVWTPPAEEVASQETEEADAPCTLTALRRTWGRLEPSIDSHAMDRINAGAELEAFRQATGDGFTWWMLRSGTWVRGDHVTASAGCEQLPIDLTFDDS